MAKNIPEIYGSLVFNDKVMKKKRSHSKDVEKPEHPPLNMVYL